MNIIAIDPGTERSAVLQWCGRILWAEIMTNEKVLERLRDCLVPQECILAIEMIASYGMPVGREVFETCVWIGRYFEAWENNGCERTALLIYRRDVKLHHCGNARAKDSNIRQALIDKYGVPGTKKAPGVTYGLKADMWSAFAIATYVSETEDKKE